MILSDDIVTNGISCVQRGYGKESQTRFCYQIGRLLGQSCQKKNISITEGNRKLRNAELWFYILTASTNILSVNPLYIYSPCMCSSNSFTLISLIIIEPTLTNLKNSTLHKKKITLQVYWFLRSFPPSTPRLLELCISFFLKIPPSRFIPTSTFSDLAYFALPPGLFQPPSLLERWE